MQIDSWDSKIDIPLFTAEVRRITKTFYAFFSQMPYLLDWCNECKGKFHYCDHVTWVKRNGMPIQPRLMRSHEEIFIYSIDSTARYYQTKGRYEDVKLPGILFDTYTIDTFQRYTSDLRREIKTGIKRKNGHGKQHAAFVRPLKPSDRSPEFADYTNVWSFLPANQKTFNKGGKEHPTQKPILLMERLVELLTPPDAVVLDPFMGSGTTGVVCAKLGRQFIGIEQSPEYFEIAQSRINKALEEPEQRELFDNEEPEIPTDTAVLENII